MKIELQNPFLFVEHNLSSSLPPSYRFLAVTTETTVDFRPVPTILAKLWVKSRSFGHPVKVAITIWYERMCMKREKHHATKVLIL